MKSIQKQQARLIKLMRAGARHYIDNVMHTDTIAATLADHDLRSMSADEQFVDWTRDQLTDMRDNLKNIYLGSHRSSAAKLSGMIQDILQLNLDDGEVSVELTGTPIDYKKGLRLRLEQGLSDFYQAIAKKNPVLAQVLNFESDLWVDDIANNKVPVGFDKLVDDYPEFVGRLGGCTTLTNQLIEGETLPDQLRSQQAAMIRDELAPIRKAATLSPVPSGPPAGN